MLDLLTVAYAQFVIVPIELQKLLIQELTCLCSKTAIVQSEWTEPETMDVSLLHFYCIRDKFVV
jgi:hypothetical protein